MERISYLATNIIGLRQTMFAEGRDFSFRIKSTGNESLPSNEFPINLPPPPVLNWIKTQPAYRCLLAYTFQFIRSK